MKIIKLRTGKEVPEVEGPVAYTALRRLATENPVAAFELYHKCLDSTFPWSKATLDTVTKVKLCFNGLIPTTVKYIVEAALIVIHDSMTVLDVDEVFPR